MTIKEFCDAYKAKKFVNTNERVGWIKKALGVKPYIPFREKRKIAEMIVERNIKEVDGLKKYDSINGYVGLMVASIAAHTELDFGSDAITDYDLLAESGLLTQIIAEFQSSHNEIDIILKMALAMELEGNNVNALVGRFLNKISGLLDDVAEAVKDKFEDFDLQSALGVDFKDEDLAQLKGFLDKFK